jgi:5-methylcytosine-specific restriction protein A
MEVSKEELQTAMKLFDRTLRNTKHWCQWKQNLAHLYAIQGANDLYPVKKVISLATGMAVSKLHGGPGRANAIVEEAGFTVIRLHPD